MNFPSNLEDILSCKALFSNNMIVCKYKFSDKLHTVKYLVNTLTFCNQELGSHLSNHDGQGDDLHFICNPSFGFSKC